MAGRHAVIHFPSTIGLAAQTLLACWCGEPIMRDAYTKSARFTTVVVVQRLHAYGRGGVSPALGRVMGHLLCVH